MVLIAVELPPPGTPIGGHFQGANFSARQMGYQMTDAARLRWSLEAKRRGERQLRLAGYFVEEVESSSDARRLDNVDYGLSGQVQAIDVRTTGSSPPHLVDASVEVSWELLDLLSGGVILGRNVTGSTRLTGTVDSAVIIAIEQSLGRLLADSVFLRALSAPRSDAPVDIGRGWRPLPARDDTIFVDLDDLNPSPDTAALARITFGVASLHGAGGGYFGSAFLLTRDGMALTADRVMRSARGARNLRARLSSGVERPVRMVRRDIGLNVALIQIQCPGDCPTVDWRTPPFVDVSQPVMIVGATGTRAVMSPGLIGGRWGLAHGVTLDTDSGSAGEPIGSPSSGRVFAMVGGVPGRPMALMLDQILRVLRVRPAGELRR